MRLNIKLSLILISIPVLFIATKCDDYDDYTYVETIRIEVVNVNNEGENPIISNQPINKEAYMIAAKELYNIPLTKKYNIRKDSIISEKIFTNTDFDEQHPKGSEVTHLFQKVRSHYYVPDYQFSYVLRKTPHTGIYSFNIEMMNTRGKIYQASTNSIELY